MNHSYKFLISFLTNINMMHPDHPCGGWSPQILSISSIDNKINKHESLAANFHRHDQSESVNKTREEINS